MAAGVNEGHNGRVSCGRVQRAVLTAGLAWSCRAVDLAIGFYGLLLQGERVGSVGLPRDGQDGAGLGRVIRRKEPSGAFANCR